MNQYFSIISVICLVLSFGCQSKKSEPNSATSPTTEKAKSAPLSFKSQTLTRQSDNCSGDTCAHLSIETVLAEGGTTPLRDSLNQYVQHYLLRQQLTNNPDADLTPKGDAVDVLANYFMQAHKQSMKEDLGPVPGLGWELKITMKPIYQTPNIVSLRLNSMGYTGGAHGYDVTTLQSFDSTGHAIRLKEMVTDTVKLRNVIEQEFRQVRQLGKESLESQGIYSQGQGLPFPQNAALTEKGLLLYYNAYEVNAYAFGPTELLLPFSQLQNFIKPTYLPGK